MAFKFKNNIVVGVSISSEVGLEVAQIDFLTRTVLKYGSKPIQYDELRQEIADLDIFKETLQDLFLELQIPKGSEVVINLPTTYFKVADYPASLNEEQVMMALEEELVNVPIFQNNEPCVSAVALPNSTIQFTKIAYTAASKVMLIELAMQIKELGYTLVAIDSSINSTLNALIYNERVNVNPDVNWVLLLIENNRCRLVSMQGRNYVDSFEERISIGEVLGDDENYSIVSSAVNPLLKNLPSHYLYVVSKTSVISAEVLAPKLMYNAQIIHEEMNKYAKEPYIEVSSDVPSEIANQITLDVIGAGIYREFVKYSSAKFNLFNASLGDVYILEQPPVLKFNSLSFVLSIENMTVCSVVLALIVLLLNIIILLPLNGVLQEKEDTLRRQEGDIKKIQKYLDDNKDVSTAMFDEGDEIKMGLINNKNVYTYYTIVGTEIPKKLWLTSLNIGKYTTIEGQADNLESVYAFFRNIRDYNPSSNIKLQKLALATNSKMSTLTEEEAFDTDSIITSMDADFYEFRISNAPEEVKDNKKSSDSVLNLPGLEPLN